jgi:hypothetical protein
VSLYRCEKCSSVGLYEITVRESGFQDAVLHLAVPAGAAFELPVTLRVSGIDTTVTVTADASVLEAARSQIAATVSEAEVRRLPMNGRNFLELALLVPGVSPANVGSTQLFPETSAVLGVTLSVASQRNLSNNFIVDGLSANDDAAGLSGIAYGVDAIEQFQMVTSGAQAQLGRALGGYVNVVTHPQTELSLDAVLRVISRELSQHGCAVNHDIAVAVLGNAAASRDHNVSAVQHLNKCLSQVHAADLHQYIVLPSPCRPDYKTTFGDLRVVPFNPERLLYWSHRGKAHISSIWPLSQEERRLSESGSRPA